MQIISKGVVQYAFILARGGKMEAKPKVNGKSMRTAAVIFITENEGDLFLWRKALDSYVV